MGTSISKLLDEELLAVNIGLEDFTETLQAQNVQVLHVDWAPPAGGDPELMAILDKLL